MKILLDECVTKQLKSYLPAHEVYTVHQMRWNGLKNGELLAQCASSGFDMIITIDKNISTQQNIARHPVIIAVFHSVSSKIEELSLFISTFDKSLQNFKKGNLYYRKAALTKLLSKPISTLPLHLIFVYGFIFKFAFRFAGYHR